LAAARGRPRRGAARSNARTLDVHLDERNVERVDAERAQRGREAAALHRPALQCALVVEEKDRRPGAARVALHQHVFVGVAEAQRVHAHALLKERVGRHVGDELAARRGVGLKRVHLADKLRAVQPRHANPAANVEHFQRARPRRVAARRRRPRRQPRAPRREQHAADHLERLAFPRLRQGNSSSK
jgi:hypothetical protein